MTAAFWQRFKRQFLCELKVSSRHINSMLTTVLFFIVFVALFPLSMAADPLLFKSIAPGLVWMALLLSFLMAASRIFMADYEQGVIEQWLSYAQSLTAIVFAKLCFHCLLNLLPILLISPLIGLIFELHLHEVILLDLSLLCGAPAILALCALASVFGLGAGHNNALMAIIILPLTVPIIIFGSGAALVAMQGLPISGYLALELALSILALSLLPFAIAAVIRVSLVD